MSIARRTGILLAAVILILGALLPACSNTGSVKKDQSAESAASGKDKLKPVELSWYVFVDQKMKDEDKVFEELNKYLKSKINVTVRQNLLTGEDFTAKVPVIIASGQPYDICFTASWSNNYLPNVAKGAFREITDDMLDKYAKETKEAVPQLMWDGIKVNGKIYGIPTYKEIGHQFGYFINKDMADKYGLDISNIKKWTDIEPVLKALKEKEPGIIGNMAGGGVYYAALPHEHVSGDWNLPGVLNIAGMETYKRNDDKVFNQYETPEYKAFTEVMRRWWKEGYIPKDPIKYGTQIDDYKANKLFSFMIHYAPAYENTFSKTTGVNTVYIPLYDPIVETVDITGNGLYAVSVNSLNPERALMFLNLVNTDIKVGTMIRHGIEGIHYRMVGDQLDRTAVEGIDVKNHPYDYVFGWQFGTPFNQIWDISYPRDIKDIFMKYNESGKRTACFGFSFDAAPVQNEIAAIQNIMKQYRDPLDNGMVDPDKYLPEYISRLKSNGVDKLINEIQKQVDAWKAASGK